MIEQTELIIIKWQYQPTFSAIDDVGEKLTSFITLNVLKKRTATKKGIAWRLRLYLYLKKKRS